MANILLIPGSGHGGWAFDPIADDLRAAGHKVIAATLTGLDDGKIEQVPINLDTHIDDVLELIRANRLDHVVLVGHSYGGMVITGVADRTAAKVEALIYLDGMLPLPGQRLWDLLEPDLQNTFLGSVTDGLNLHADPEFKRLRPRVMPHPLATMLQPLQYSEAIFQAPVKVYVFAEKFFGDPEQLSPFRAIYNRLSKKPDWQTHSLPFGHDLVDEAPEQVLQIILKSIS